MHLTKVGRRAEKKYSLDPPVNQAQALLIISDLPALREGAFLSLVESDDNPDI